MRSGKFSPKLQLPLDPSPVERVQELGLATAYKEDAATHSYISRLMALPFLPHELIPTVFELLELEATTDPLQQFVRYIRSTWIESTVWLPPR